MREYGKGYVSKNRTVWRAFLTWRDEDNKLCKTSKNTPVKCYPDKRDDEGNVLEENNRGKARAEQFLQRWRTEMVEKEKERGGSRSSVVDYATEYVDEKVATAQNAAATTDGYRSYIHKLEKADLGSLPMADVTSRDIVSWVSGFYDEGLGANTISHHFVFLKQVFTQAVKRGDLPSNPFDAVDAPKREQGEINSLSKDGVISMNKALDEYGLCPLTVAAHLAVMTSMRLGEICGLRWCDVDLKDSRIHVNHALKRAKGGFVLGPPKTKKSRRDIPFSHELLDILLRWRSETEQTRSEFGLGWDDNLYVIGHPTDGTWQSTTCMSREWKIFARQAKIVGTQGHYVQFRDLRHVFASHAVAEHIDVKVVSSVMGHSNAAMTLNTYTDDLEDSKRTGMEKLGVVLSDKGD